MENVAPGDLLGGLVTCDFVLLGHPRDWRTSVHTEVIRRGTAWERV